MHQSYSCSFKNKIRVPHPQGENLNLRSATSKESSVVIDVIDGDAGRAIDEDQFYKDLRGMQKETNCTEKVVLQFISKFEKYCKCPIQSSLSSHDKKMQVNFEFEFVANSRCVVHILPQAQAGVGFLSLNGCPGCDKFVYLPNDKRKTCPYVKADGQICGEPRFNEDGQPKEV